MLHKISLEDLVSETGVLQRDEALVRNNILLPLKKTAEIERAAERLAATLAMLSSARHSADSEIQQLRRIQDHVRLVQQIEVRDAEKVLSDIRHLVLAERYNANTNNFLYKFLHDMNVQEDLLKKIKLILERQDVERYDLIKHLIGNLLVNLRDAQYHAEECVKGLQEEAAALKKMVEKYRV